MLIGQRKNQPPVTFLNGPSLISGLFGASVFIWQVLLLYPHVILCIPAIHTQKSDKNAICQISREDVSHSANKTI